MTIFRILSFAAVLSVFASTARAETAVPTGTGDANLAAAVLLDRFMETPASHETMPFAGVFAALVSAINPPDLIGMLTEPATVPVVLYNVNSHETATFHITRDGVVDAADAEHLKSFFMCRRTRRRKAMDPGVLAMLAAVARQYPNHVIEVISGYRAPPYGAPRSKHFQGNAIDLRVRGVKSTVVRDFLWRTQRGVGVGHYHRQNFIHLDHRPTDKDVAWSSAREGARYHFNPRWSRRVREQAPKTIAWR